MGNLGITHLDTPGHVDFSAEMERTLQVLDYAILVINGADGVQGHTRTLWRLLKRYQIPTFIFINKMDQVGTDKAKVLADLQNRLDEGCIDFSEITEETYDSLAMCDEKAMEEYLESEKIEEDTIAEIIGNRKAYPCYFGSALKMEGVQEFMDGMTGYVEKNEQINSTDTNTSNFGAKVFKISRDPAGSRLTYLKVTSGTLKVKDTLTGIAGKQQSKKESDLAQDRSETVMNSWEEKVNQIRIYSGEKYEMVQEAKSGMVCAVTGLNYTYPGEGLGIECDSEAPALEPVLSYKIELPEGCDVHKMLGNLRILEEEDPMLKIVWNEELGEIHAKLMGAVQIEILKSLIKDRFGVDVEFDTGNIVYKETIQNTVEGVGHFEPLRHYAEVHLKMEPGERGSGIVIGTDCSEDMLDKNWQRLILTHLLEKEHRGVLTGSVITDMKITLTATSSAKPISCVTTIMGIPSRANSRMTSNTSPTICGSRADVGSSKRSTSGVTSDPFCSTCAPRTLRSASCMRCVAVWLLAAACRFSGSTRAVNSAAGFSGSWFTIWMIRPFSFSVATTGMRSLALSIIPMSPTWPPELP